MAAPADLSETGMANGALSHIGEPPITSLDDTTRAAARYAKKFFAETRDDLLRERDWEFARTDCTPAGVTCPNPHWAFRYTMPADCVNVLRIGDWDDSEDEPEWECPSTGDDVTVAIVLDTNEVAPHVYYTRRVVNPAQWDAGFRRLFKIALAIALNPLIGRDKSLTAGLINMLENKTGDAERRDAQQRSGQQISRSTSWVRARFGFTAANSGNWNGNS